MSGKQFTMSMYASKEELYREKAIYYATRSDRYKEELEQLRAENERLKRKVELWKEGAGYCAVAQTKTEACEVFEEYLELIKAIDVLKEPDNDE